MNQRAHLKKLLVKRLIDTNINISPSALQVFMEVDKPLEKLDQIIKETTFIPSFKSNLTIETLQSISNEEIQIILERLNSSQGKTKKESSVQEKALILNGNSLIPTEEESEENKGDNTSSNVASPLLTATSSSLAPDILSPLAPGSPLEYDENETIEGSIPIRQDEDLDDLPLMEDKETSQEPPETHQHSRKEITEKLKNLSHSSSNLRFKPLAKEYDFNYHIKMDPTGKLFTSGEYTDFYNMTLDKFKKLKKLMRKRPETNSATNINTVKKFSENKEVSIIGLVKNIRRTKNEHYFFELEDLTGSVNVLVRNDSEKRDLLNIIKNTIEDQMLYVAGTYNKGKEDKEGIIFANVVSKIDIPMEFKPKTSAEPLSVALLSDMHIGSAEFEEPLWNRFLEFLNGNLGNKQQRSIAGKIKYLIINGDLVDGVGVYPNQQEDLIIPDIYDQFKKAAELFSAVPEYIKIILSSGNHEPVRNAIPRPAVPKKYCNELINLGVKVVGNPCMVETHNITSLVFHGDSLLDLNLSIPGLSNDKPAATMKELLICRHLAPSFGNKTQIAPTEKDWLIINEVPNIFHTGHLHINGFGIYRGVRLVNSGCFQAQTDFMKSLGISPTPGEVPIIELDTLKNIHLDLKTIH
ncbi:MAG: DNA polymerase II small subunit [Promethearchaeota archaeon]|nr:MAG: DNA polymerase II small subunit [Candidatus Lokiarchaeota archaeon]